MGELVLGLTHWPSSRIFSAADRYEKVLGVLAPPPSYQVDLPEGGGVDVTSDECLGHPLTHSSSHFLGDLISSACAMGKKT